MESLDGIEHDQQQPQPHEVNRSTRGSPHIANIASSFVVSFITLFIKIEFFYIPISNAQSSSNVTQKSTQ